jgi:kynurenine/2-aminoadipate aminotransferase
MHGLLNAQENPKSFLSMDEDGRVMRFDSFSKVLSSGLRVGYATGPKPLVRSLELFLQATLLHASSLSQVNTLPKKTLKTFLTLHGLKI